MYTVKSSPLAVIHTQAPSVSASQPSLNISCAEFVPWGQAANVKAIHAPEFVPRGQQVAIGSSSLRIQQRRRHFLLPLHLRDRVAQVTWTRPHFDVMRPGPGKLMPGSAIPGRNRVVAGYPSHH